jgi:hypothetical protein
MVLMRPTSIVVAGVGATASIGVNGSVTFTSATSLSLNGVFTSGFDNYMISMRLNASPGDDFVHRFRVSGSDNSTASSYVGQYLDANNTTISGARQALTYGRGAYAAGTQRGGFTYNIYGPALTQPTAWRCISSSDGNSAYIFDVAGTHNQSVTYDGITFLQMGSGLFTGLVSVYGLGG